MEIRSIRDLGAHEAAFLALEHEASRPYRSFVYDDEDQALQIRRLLLEKEASEFAPPYARLLFEDREMSGIMACLSHRQLLGCRLRAALVLKREGVFRLQPQLERAIHAASRTLVKTREGDYYLSRIAIHAVARGRGLARALVRHFEAEGRDLHSKRLMLEVDPRNGPAVDLYLSEGFETLERVQATDAQRGRTLEYLHMAKSL